MGELLYCQTIANTAAVDGSSFLVPSDYSGCGTSWCPDMILRRLSMNLGVVGLADIANET